MEIDVFTLFPAWFEWFTSQRHVANAVRGGARLHPVDLREHTPLSGGQVDDAPFGGGAGMVLRVDVMDSALRAHYRVDPTELRERRRIVALAPNGRPLDDRLVDELAGEPSLTLLCGRYEGFDERILEHLVTESISIGPYVLSGGELAAMVLCDAVLRKLPGRSGTPTRPSRSPSARPWAATPSIPTTPVRLNTAAGASPRSCSRATTRRSATGASSRARIGDTRAPPGGPET